MKRIPILPLLVFSGLTLAGCSSTPSEEPSPPTPEEPEAEDTCTKWILDIDNRTAREVDVYLFHGDTLVSPRTIPLNERPPYSPKRSKLVGPLIQRVPRWGKKSALLDGNRPVVMVYENHDYRWWWLLALATPDEQRERWPWSLLNIVLQFTCESS